MLPNASMPSISPAPPGSRAPGRRRAAPTSSDPNVIPSTTLIITIVRMPASRARPPAARLPRSRCHYREAEVAANASVPRVTERRAAPSATSAVEIATIRATSNGPTMKKSSWTTASSAKAVSVRPPRAR